MLSESELRAVLALLDESERTVEPGRPVLTTRETEILQLLVEGLSAQEIDLRLRISSGTRRTHMSNILAKLGVHSQIQAVSTALRAGIIQLPPATGVRASS